MAGTVKLYTHDVLSLATSLSQWPLNRQLPRHGAARSATCGSTIERSLAVEDAARIAAIGLAPQACAIGQASAALFVRAAIGRNAIEIEAALAAIQAWLKGEAQLPDWPGFGAIAAARDYPARHGAITLAWEAALRALSSAA